MDQIFTAETNVAAEQLYDIVADLDTFPRWMPLVNKTERVGPEPAWIVTLKAQIGPLARAKRLRMVRTEADGQQVRFDRQELDGRTHAPWTLSAAVKATGDATSSVTIELHYGGSMWTGPLEAVLNRSAADATASLNAYVDQLPT